MCGIAGIYDPRGKVGGAELLGTVRRMSGVLASRGPDGEGLWSDAEAGIAFGHRRLSIIDPSEAGTQPMASADGRFVVTYNGEIYNFPDLNRDLDAAGIRRRGGSDTETLVETIALAGVERTLERLNGIFAFAVWDRRERRLHLARDQLGIKPLVWTRRGGVVAFASQLSAIRAALPEAPPVDREALAAFHDLGYIPGELTIYEGVHKVAPGGTIAFSAGSDEPRRTRYWSLAALAEAGRADPFRGSDAEAIEACDALVGQCVRDQMVSDVPLGAYLSGGIDSSLVVAHMQREGSGRARTFTIGFTEAHMNEAPHAEAVAKHLGTDHTELYCRPEDALAVIPRLPDLYDEPLGDPSSIPTYMISGLARRHVTVALGGDGGDEAFGGYERYLQIGKLLRLRSALPAPVRGLLAGAISSVSPTTWDRVPGAPRLLGHKLHKLGDMLRTRSEDDLIRKRGRIWDGPLVHGVGAPREELFAGAGLDPVARMQLVESLTWLPEDVLAKVDRASMAVGLEARVPLLDLRLLAFAWRLPLRMKIRDGQGKWLLRQVLYRHVPRPLVDRPKMGFGIPMGEWLRGPLRDWAEDLLDEKALREQGLLDAARLRRYWTDHLTGGRNWQTPIWSALMFQQWHRRWMRA